MNTHPSARIDAVDQARGLAVVAMVAYHASWDLVAFGYAGFDLLHDPWWLAARTIILCAFLVLSGLGLALSAERGLTPRRYLRRTGFLVLAATAVSVGSWWVFPDRWIFFGVLHHLAVASLLALPFLRLPAGLVLISGLCLLSGSTLSVPVFDHPWLQWIGMTTRAPVSNDYVPLIPWFGVVLIGLGAGRLWPHQDAIARWRASSLPTRILRRLGRASLIVYLLHQPMLFGGFWLATALFPATPPAIESYLESCRSSCESTGMEAKACESACRCTADTLSEEGLLGALDHPETLSAAQFAHIEKIVHACR